MEPKSRPYPWICGFCRVREVYPEIIKEYIAEVRHDNELHKILVKNLRVSICKKCGEIFFSNNSSDDIVTAERQQLNLLSSEEMKEIVAKSGLSDNQICEKLDITEKELNDYFESFLIQSRKIDNLFRQL